jgi:hypothetical protein
MGFGQVWHVDIGGEAYEAGGVVVPSIGPPSLVDYFLASVRAR